MDIWNWDELKTIPDMPNTLGPLLGGLKGPASLKVQKPCCGVCGDLLLWKAMGTETIVDTFDIEAEYEAAIRKIHSEEGSTHCIGEDLLKIDLPQLQPTSFLLSGPPCPPWAGNGCKGSEKDVRSHVYSRILQWICHQMDMECMQAFAIENVDFIKASIDGKTPFMDRVLTALMRHDKSSKWSFDCKELQLKDYGLPQSRRRAILRGQRKTLGLLPLLLPKQPMQPLRNFLSTTLPHQPPATMRDSHRQNLRDYEREIKLRKKLHPRMFANDPIAVFSVDRAFDKKWNIAIRLDEVPTLTTVNRYLFLLSTNDQDEPPEKREFHRYLHFGERFGLQGMSWELLAENVPPELSVKATGNAFPPQLLAAAIAPMIALIAKAQPVLIENVPAPTRTTKDFRLPKAKATGKGKSKAKAKAKSAMKSAKKKKAMKSAMKGMRTKATT